MMFFDTQKGILSLQGIPCSGCMWVFGEVLSRTLLAMKHPSGISYWLILFRFVHSDSSSEPRMIPTKMDQKKQTIFAHFAGRVQSHSCTADFWPAWLSADAENQSPSSILGRAGKRGNLRVSGFHSLPKGETNGFQKPFIRPGWEILWKPGRIRKPRTRQKWNFNTCWAWFFCMLFRWWTGQFWCKEMKLWNTGLIHDGTWPHV